MKPEWASSREDPYIIDLSDDNPDNVPIYVQWLYRGKLQIDIFESTAAGLGACSARGRAIFSKLTKAFLFGEKIMDIPFQNSIIMICVAAHRTLNTIPSPDVVTSIYGGTAAGSRLRRLLADMIAFADPADQRVWKKCIQSCPCEAVDDVILAMTSLRPFTNKDDLQMFFECTSRKKMAR
jgi:hypothetical protein